jgi:hypothetical protein
LQKIDDGQQKKWSRTDPKGRLYAETALGLVVGAPSTVPWLHVEKVQTA